MADIVSVAWNVQESRRVITEQPLSSDPRIAVAKPVRLLNVKIDSAPIAPDPAGSTAQNSNQDDSPSPAQITAPPANHLASAPIINQAGSTASGVAAIVQRLPPQPAHLPDAAPQTSAAANPPTPANQISATPTRPEIPNSPPAALSSGEPRPQSRPMPGPIVTQPAVAAHDENFSPLRKAILDPDIHTARADRDRAIALRWTLRDIVANRLKLWPVGDVDLAILIDFGLVELKDGTPLLTGVGMTAINRAAPEFR